MKYAVVGLVLLGIILFFYAERYEKNELQTPSEASAIIFPQGGESLIEGETYTLRWTGGPNPITLFLVDRSLKDQGASVAISDRIYGIENKGAHEYKVPENMKPGEYEFQIGKQTSKPFSIVAK